MGMFDGFPFVSKEERERRRKDFEKRVAPFGVEDQREKLKETLSGLFPGADQTDIMFKYYNAKDAYTIKETKEEGFVAAQMKLRRTQKMDGRTETILLRLIELDTELTSLDEFPTAEQVLEGLFGEQ